MKRHLAAIMLACAACAPAANAAPVLQSPNLDFQPSLQAQERTGAGNRSAPSDAAAPVSADSDRDRSGGDLARDVDRMISSLAIGGVSGSIVAAALLVAMLALAILIIARMVRRPEQELVPMREPVFAGTAHSARQTAAGLRGEPQFTPPRPAPAGGGWGVPADFDVPAFLRSAKAYFIRLQASWDRSDLNDIRAFVTPEMFAELALQLEERGAVGSQTTVAILHADLLGIETTGTEYVASVKFSGMIKTSAQAMAEPFIEIWSLSRPVAVSGGWLLAGIQQLQ